MGAMLRPIVLACALLSTAAAASASQVYRCASAGTVSYQQMPCATAAEERPYDLPSYPPVNMLERDRLLAREAALDARLLRRAEIDAQERIAREARLAQEAAIAAEIERARTTEAGYFYPAYPVVRPRVTHHRTRAPSVHDQVMGTSGLQRIR